MIEDMVCPLLFNGTSLVVVVLAIVEVKGFSQGVALVWAIGKDAVKGQNSVLCFFFFDEVSLVARVKNDVVQYRITFLQFGKKPQKSITMVIYRKFPYLKLKSKQEEYKNC